MCVYIWGCAIKYSFLYILCVSECVLRAINSAKIVTICSQCELCREKQRQRVREYQQRKGSFNWCEQFRMYIKNGEQNWRGQQFDSMMTSRKMKCKMHSRLKAVNIQEKSNQKQTYQQHQQVKIACTHSTGINSNRSECCASLSDSSKQNELSFDYRCFYIQPTEEYGRTELFYVSHFRASNQTLDFIHSRQRCHLTQVQELSVNASMHPATYERKEICL